MLLRTQRAAVAAILIFTPAAVAGEGPAAPHAAAAELRLVGEALAAVGIDDPVDRAADQRDVRRAIAEVVAAMGEGRPTYRRAVRLHRLLHRDHLRHYREDADGLDDVVASGEFNCLSATLFYGLVARKLGYDVVVLEFPGHLLLGLEIDGRRIEVETTTPHGFDRPRDAADRSRGRKDTFGRIPGIDRRRTSDEFGDSESRSYWQVPLEAAVGFTWLNTAWRSLEAGEAVAAADSVAEARRFLPDLSTQESNIRRLLCRAFRSEYESGDFERAYRIASVEVDLFPARTTARDRLLAAAIKRVEDSCDLDLPRRAATVVEDVARIVISGRDAARFERRAWPIVTAASVRLADWPLAQRAAGRYARVEPDSIEARRVVDWVERRRLEAAPSWVQPFCFEPVPSELRVNSH